MELKFLRYDATPGEKHLGVATIRIEEGIRIILRFKVVPKEHGGYYYQPASHKVSVATKDVYYPAFSLDSTYEYDEVKAFIAENVDRILSQQNNSVFGSPAPVQSPNQPYRIAPQSPQMSTAIQSAIDTAIASPSSNYEGPLAGSGFSAPPEQNLPF